MQQRNTRSNPPSTETSSNVLAAPAGISHISPDVMRELAREACGVLKQLANEQRLMVLCHLADGEKTVSELQNLVGLEQSSLSQHLAKLRNEGIIHARRRSQSKFYSITDENTLQIIGLLHSMYCSPVE